MINPRYANHQQTAVLLDAGDGTGRVIYADGGAVLVDALAGVYGAVGPYVPHVPTAPDLGQIKAAKLARINTGKNTALDGGFLHDGMLFDSDTKARLAYLELGFKMSTVPTYTTPWKASTGVWVTMDAALFAALQPAYEAHIQACFQWQAMREMEVAAAETVGAVEAVSEVM